MYQYNLKWPRAAEELSAKQLSPIPEPVQLSYGETVVYLMVRSVQRKLSGFHIELSGEGARAVIETVHDSDDVTVSIFS